MAIPNSMDMGGHGWTWELFWWTALITVTIHISGQQMLRISFLYAEHSHFPRWLPVVSSSKFRIFEQCPISSSVPDQAPLGQETYNLNNIGGLPLMHPVSDERTGAR